MASFICTDRALYPDPCSGKSEAIRSLGRPLPPYSTPPQNEVGNDPGTVTMGARRAWLAAPACTVTQALESPAARLAGAPPTSIELTRLVDGSMRATVPVPDSVTHTAPSPADIALALSPTVSGSVAVTDCSRGSIRTTLGVLPVSTQTEPSPAAIAIGSGVVSLGRPTI